MCVFNDMQIQFYAEDINAAPHFGVYLQNNHYRAEMPEYEQNFNDVRTINVLIWIRWINKNEDHKSYAWWCCVMVMLTWLNRLISHDEKMSVSTPSPEVNFNYLCEFLLPSAIECQIWCTVTRVLLFKYDW